MKDSLLRGGGEEVNMKRTIRASVLLISFALMIGLLFNGCGILGGTVEEERVDRFGTPESRWVWRYGLIGGEEEILCFDEWYTDFEVDLEECRRNPRSLECRFIPVLSVAGFREQDTITVNNRTHSISGSGMYISYLQIRVNGSLVRHRNPHADAYFLVGPNESFFETDKFPLKVSKNQIEIIAFYTRNIEPPNRGKLVKTTLYIYREN